MTPSIERSAEHYMGMYVKNVFEAQMTTVIEMKELMFSLPPLTDHGMSPFRTPVRKCGSSSTCGSVCSTAGQHPASLISTQTAHLVSLWKCPVEHYQPPLSLTLWRVHPRLARLLQMFQTFWFQGLWTSSRKRTVAWTKDLLFWTCHKETPVQRLSLQIYMSGKRQLYLVNRKTLVKHRTNSSHMPDSKRQEHLRFGFDVILLNTN